MRSPRVVLRSPLSLAVITLALVSTLYAQQNQKTNAKPGPPYSKTERLVPTPENLAFGRVAIGRRKFQTVTITNSTASDITLVQVITQGGDFSVTGLDLPVTLAAGESYTFRGVFSPRSKGASNGSIAFLSDASSISNPTLSMQLSGIGEDEQLKISPVSMSFGGVQLGLSANQWGTLIAGANQVIISSGFSSSKEFTLSGLSFPLIIPARGSQGFMVTFTPQSSGTVAATLSFTDESGFSLALEPLNGTGVSSQNHSVGLSWTASTSNNVVGYNIYRGNQSGGPYAKINSVLDSTTAYTDTDVIDGNTYFYVTTAVNSENEESGYSNQAPATIP